MSSGYMFPWKRGTSLSFFGDRFDETVPRFGEKGFGKTEKEILDSVREQGFDCVELSFRHDDYLQRFCLQKNAGRLRSYCTEIGLQVWSLHLPFSSVWDISGPCMEETLADDEILVRAAAEAGCSVVVVHPSFEPIAAEERGGRLERAREGIYRLNLAVRREGMTLGVENLPRTCLGNTSEEMIRLLSDAGASWLFDTNHSLQEENLHFLKNMLGAGYVPCSLHISDYDFADECHDLPGSGVNAWKDLLGMLQNAGYGGPAMYEIRHVLKNGRVLDLEDLSRNMDLLLMGSIG